MTSTLEKPQSQKGLVESKVQRWLRMLLDDVPAKVAAAKLGIPKQTVEHAMRESSAYVLRFDAFYAILSRDDVAPFQARQAVLDELLDDLGLVAVDESRACLDVAPISRQHLELASAYGQLAKETLEGLAPGSDGGGDVSAAEAERMLPAIREVMRECAELVTALERRAAGTA